MTPRPGQHAHRHQHWGDYEVDDQEGQKQQEADLDGALEQRDELDSRSVSPPPPG